jgi:cytochrome c
MIKRKFSSVPSHLRFASAALLVAAVSPLNAALTYPGCSDLAGSDFKEVVLVGRTATVGGVTALAVDANLLEPVGLYVHPDGKVYWAERFMAGNSHSAQNSFGKIKMFNPSNNTVTTVLNLPAAAGATGGSGNAELGVRFVTLHPDFDVNRWAYVYYMPRATATGKNVDTMLVSRFNVKTDGMFDTTSEKKILRMPWTPGICCHQGGAMDWDAQGNLFITTGNNAENSNNWAPMENTLNGTTGANKDRATMDNQARTANTMDWRGKVLRIRPDSSTKGYSIPAGNLRQRFFELGGAWVVGQDTNKILPEIYSFGDRNAYTLSVDKPTGWITLGVVGPDNGTGTSPTNGTAGGPAGNDEFNLNTKPSFNGWPYFVGTNRGYNMWNPANNNYSLPPQSPDTVFNNSPHNTGVTKLIPATPSILPESKQGSLNTGVSAAFGTSGGTAATTGPIYHYALFPTSMKKLPPHLDGKWIIAESARNKVFVATINSTGTAVTDVQEIPGDAAVFKPSGSYGIVDMKMGPEGALYIAHYSAAYFAASATTRISRIEYQGTCVGPTPVIGKAVRENPSRGILLANLGDRRLTWPEGMRSAEVYDVGGRQVWNGMRQGSEESSNLPSALHSGVFRVLFKP